MATPRELGLDNAAFALLVDLFHESLNRDGLVDSVQYAADHSGAYDAMQRLGWRSFIKEVAGTGDIRLTFVSFTLIDHPEAIRQVDLCEIGLRFLRGRYIDRSTRTTPTTVALMRDHLEVDDTQVQQTIELMKESALGGAFSSRGTVGEVMTLLPTDQIMRSEDFSAVLTQTQANFMPENHPLHRVSALNLDIAPDAIEPAAAKGSVAGQVLFQDGSRRDAYVEIRTIFQKARKTLCVVDPFLDSKTLGLIQTTTARPLEVKLLSKSYPTDFSTELQLLLKDHPELRIEARINSTFHDRFILVDDSTAYHFGTSINHAGGKVFMINLVHEPELVGKIIALVNARWYGSPEI